MTLTRRAMLAGTAASAIVPFTAASPARAFAPAAGRQAPGFYRYKVGSSEVTVVTDGVSRFRFADDHVGNKTRACAPSAAPMASRMATSSSATMVR